MGAVLAIHAAKVMSLGIVLMLILTTLNPIFKTKWLRKIIGLCMFGYLIAMFVLK